VNYLNGLENQIEEDFKFEQAQTNRARQAKTLPPQHRKLVEVLK